MKETKVSTNKNAEASKGNFLPTDYMMSSWDIADALKMEHKEVLAIIKETSDLYINSGLWDSFNGLENNKPTTFYMFSLRAVMGFAEGLTVESGNGLAEYTVLKKFFSLASGSTKPVKDAHSYALLRIKVEHSRISAYLENLEASRSITNNSEAN